MLSCSICPWSDFIVGELSTLRHVCSTDENAHVQDEQPTYQTAASTQDQSVYSLLCRRTIMDDRTPRSSESKVHWHTRTPACVDGASRKHVPERARSNQRPCIDPEKIFLNLLLIMAEFETVQGSAKWHLRRARDKTGHVHVHEFMNKSGQVLVKRIHGPLRLGVPTRMFVTVLYRIFQHSK